MIEERLAGDQLRRVQSSDAAWSKVILMIGFQKSVSYLQTDRQNYFQTDR